LWVALTGQTLAQGGRQVGRGHALATGQDRRVLHGVFQLAHIAGPGVFQQEAQGLRREVGHRLALLAGEVGQEMPGQQGDVAGALAQGGRWTGMTLSR
jgi:hypothetical protein